MSLLAKICGPRASIVIVDLPSVIQIRFGFAEVYALEFPLILPVSRPTDGSLPIGSLIDIPKGFSSKNDSRSCPESPKFQISDSW